MTTSVQCSCGHVVEVRAEKINRRVECPACHLTFWASRPSSPPSSSRSRSVVLPASQVLPPPLPSTRIVPPSLDLSAAAQQPAAAEATDVLAWLKHHWVGVAIGGSVAALVFLVAIAEFGLMGDILAPQPPAPAGASAAAGAPEPAGAIAERALDPGGAPGQPADNAAVHVNPPAAEKAPELAPAATTAKTLTTQEIVARSEASVALIKGRAGSGTGFVVAAGILATNAHVIADEPSRSLQVFFPSAPAKDRGPFPARLRFKDARRDLALLTVETTLPPLELSRSHVFQRGEDVTIIGCPGIGGGEVLQNAVTRGIMSTEIDVNGHRFYQLGAAVNPGNSGGPAFNSLGHVIGVVTAKAARLESIGLCIPVGDLIRALDTSANAGPDSLAKAERLHDAQAIARRLALAGLLVTSAADAYVSAAAQAAQAGTSPDMAISRQKRAMEERLAAINRGLTGDLPDQINAVRGDPHLSLEIRRELGELWGEFSNLRSWVENPRGAATGVVTALRRAKARFSEQLNRVNLALGIDPDH